MTEEQIRQTILRALNDVLPDAEIMGVRPRTSFHRVIGLDSVDMVNLALTLQRMLGIEIPESDYARLSSLASCIAYLRPRCGDKVRH